MNRDPNQLLPEVVRLLEDARREQFWKLWGPYLPDRQWGTVREDYSADSDVWNSFSHEHARSRTYRWGEDGLLGFTDRFGRLCFSFAFWNENDEILKERLFGLTGPQGNHGEDVKEAYFHLDSTPTHSYCKALYKYPQAAFPYADLIRVNAARSKTEREYEIEDTGVFDEGRYFDVVIEYAKDSIQDILIRVTATNRGPESAPLHILPTLWYRNTWSWGEISEECTEKPVIRAKGAHRWMAEHAVMGGYSFAIEEKPEGGSLFTENETNTERLYGVANESPYVKDAFHDAVVERDADAVNPKQVGTKAAAHYFAELGPGESRTLRFRLTSRRDPELPPFGDEFDRVFTQRIAEADTFYADRMGEQMRADEAQVVRQAYAGLLWSKKFYYLVQGEWLTGDPATPPPPAGHATRNPDWNHLFNRDVLSMPDAWEYPYYCTWDLAFHMVSFAAIDPSFSKQQLILLLREWYMHPNGQVPAYEWNFSDVNPPVHAWAAWRVYRLPWLLRKDDRRFLESVFQKLLMNFTWWVNRKDPEGNNLFAGGFLGLDNIGVFDRSKPLPTGGTLKQADGTAWMAFYCVQMLSIALELAQEDNVYEDLASKFFEHFVRIVAAANSFCGDGLWNEEDGFYYDVLQVDGRNDPIRVRSIVGFMPLIAATLLPVSYAENCPAFSKRVRWFMNHNSHLVRNFVGEERAPTNGAHLLSVAPRDHLERLLRRMFDEDEFLSPFGIRSVSKVHEKSPYTYYAHGVPYSVDYEPGESTTGMFGGNSNWRGPVWLPINFLLIESLRTYDLFYEDSLKVEFPTRSGNWITLGEASRLLADRVISLFMPGPDGKRPCHGDDPRFAGDPHWKDLVLFHEFFHAETGRGCGASHQTGWTALVADLINLRQKSR